MGLPGFSGFVAELMIVIGAWRAYPLFAGAVGLGILIGVAYIWRAMQKAFFSGSSTEDAGTPTAPATTLDAHITPITAPEKIAAIFLIACSVVVGLFPHILLNIIQPALNSPLFDGLRRGGTWQ